MNKFLELWKCANKKIFKFSLEIIPDLFCWPRGVKTPQSRDVLVAVNVIGGGRYPSLPLIGYLSVNGETFYVDLIFTTSLSRSKTNHVEVILREYYKPDDIEHINALIADMPIRYIDVNGDSQEVLLPAFVLGSNSKDKYKCCVEVH